MRADGLVRTVDPERNLTLFRMISAVDQDVLAERRDRHVKVRCEAGFTLMEMLVVLGIIALLAALVAPRVVSYLSKAKTESAIVQINNIASALELYYLDVGDYPTSDIGLEGLLEAPADATGWNGPYLKKLSGLIDPWERPFNYRMPGEHGDFDLYSLGRDGEPDGDGEAADITSWSE